MSTLTTRAVGTALDRIDGPEKVTGTARYAFEQPVDRPAHLYPLEATIATGRITGIDAGAATGEPGVLGRAHPRERREAGPDRRRRAGDPAVGRGRLPRPVHRRRQCGNLRDRPPCREPGQV